MPLLILTGYPCSGLTHRARQLSSLFDDLQSALPATSKSRYKIHIVTSHDKSHPRTVYDAARSEKQARAVVYARVKRLLGRDSIVIVDGMNYIKGWRYQLWCESKEAMTTCCVVHVGTPIDQCIATNDARLKRKRAVIEGITGETPCGDSSASEDRVTTNFGDGELNDANEADEEPYPPDLLLNLIYRYEEPSTSSRWDKPLFTVPWDDKKPPVEDIWLALTGQEVVKDVEQDSHAPESLFPVMNEPTSTDTGTAASNLPKSTGFRRMTSNRPKIIPHQATALPPKTDHTALYALEKITSEVISTIRKFSLENRTPPSSSYLTNPLAPGITIPISTIKTPIFIPASTIASAPTDDLAGAGGVLALPRLQRLRRQWVSMNRAYAGHGQGMGQGALNQEEVGEAFARFLNAEFEDVSEF